MRCDGAETIMDNVDTLVSAAFRQAYSTALRHMPASTALTALPPGMPAR